MTEPDAPAAAEPPTPPVDGGAEAKPPTPPIERRAEAKPRTPPLEPRAGAAPPRDPPPPVARPARDALLPWLCALGFVVLAGAIGLVWWSSQPSRSQSLTELQALTDRVAQLEQRPAPAGMDVGPLTARVATLEKRATPDLAALEARVATLEKQVADNSQFAARLDALSGRMDALSGRDQSALGDLGRRLDAVEARLMTLDHASAQMAAMAQQAAQRSRIQAAQAALAAGQPLGDLPNAPPAVVRFAAASPPTEASLRLAYPAAERAALAAGRPDTDDTPLYARLLAQTGMVVRQGDRVLVGDADADAGVLARARTALNAGDLRDAAAAVSGLSGAPAAAMAAWLANAKALLQARAGLADMAAHA